MPQVEVKINGENMEVVKTLVLLISYSSRDGGLQEDFILGAGEGLEVFGALLMRFNVGCLRLDVVTEVCGRVVV